MEPIKRKYTVSDLFMMEHSKVLRSHFNDNLPAFTAFDPALDTTFHNDWGTAVANSENQPTDEIVRDQLTQLTEAVEQAMTACRTKFQDSKYFIEKAFPNNSGVQNEFGYNNYDAQRRSQRGMTEFMKLFHGTALKYAAQLAAVNYSAAAIAEIDTLRTALDDANMAQERFEGQRPLATQTRIETHNALWDITVQVSTAAKSIYRNNPALFNMFLLPPSDETSEKISITGLMTDSVTSQPIEGGTVAVPALDISVTTDSNGRYNLAMLPNGPHDLNASAPGYDSTVLTGVVVNNANKAATVRNIALSPMAPEPEPTE
jgi:hypothetical protein